MGNDSSTHGYALGLLGVLAHSALTDLVVSESHFEEDTVVPESDVPESAGINLQSETLKLKLCDDGSDCIYVVKLFSTPSESDNGKNSSQSGQATLSYDLHVKPAGAPNAFIIDGENYTVGGETTPDAVLAGSFNDCFSKAERHAIQDSNGNVEMMTQTENSQSGVSEACSKYEKTIQNIYAGTVEALAGVFASSEDEDLLQFSESVRDVNGMRTTHYHREHHDDGSITVNHERTWELANQNPVPVLLQSGGGLLGLKSSGSSKSSKGITTKTQDQAKANIGSDSDSTPLCQGNGEADAQGRSCNTNEVPADKNTEETIRLKSETDYSVTLTSTTPVDLEHTMSMVEFLQSHAEAGRQPIAILQAITTTDEVISDPSDEEMDVRHTKFMQKLVEIGNSKPDSFEPGALRDSVHEQMRSPKIRAQTVSDLSKNKIKSGRVVQSLMHAIGRAATTQPQAIHQLIELASTAGIDKTAASQALVALIQAKCYDHEPAIRGLVKLARPDAQTFTQIVAVHVQHGLIAHAKHCANNKYTGASARKYSGVLARTHAHLEEAVADNGQLRKQTRLLAVKNLGIHYTPQALVALKELAAHPYNKGTVWQKACEQAISGELLEKGDMRKPPQAESQVVALAQLKDAPSLKYEKQWQFPSDGDIWAGPMVGVDATKEEDYADTKEDPICVRLYTGIHAKAWDWTKNIFQAGMKMCKGFKPYAYVEFLAVRIWIRQFSKGKLAKLKDNYGLGSTIDSSVSQSDDPPLYGLPDNNGFCLTNVDMMDLTTTISYDKNFLDKELSIWVGCFKISGYIQLSGEIGVKAGWGNIGGQASCSTCSRDSTPKCCKKREEICETGTIKFIIPYVQAVLTAGLALDLFLFRGGAEVEVIVLKLSLPLSYENDLGDQSSCDQAGLKVESFGGKVVAFIDRMDGLVGCGWFCLERSWARWTEWTLYEWSSPLVWVDSAVKCYDKDGKKTKDSVTNTNRRRKAKEEEARKERKEKQEAEMKEVKDKKESWTKETSNKEEVKRKENNKKKEAWEKKMANAQDTKLLRNMLKGQDGSAPCLTYQKNAGYCGENYDHQVCGKTCDYIRDGQVRADWKISCNKKSSPSGYCSFEGKCVDMSKSRQAEIKDIEKDIEVPQGVCDGQHFPYKGKCAEYRATYSRLYKRVKHRATSKSGELVYRATSNYDCSDEPNDDRIDWGGISKEVAAAAIDNTPEQTPEPTPEPTPVPKCIGEVKVFQHSNYNIEFEGATEHGWEANFALSREAYNAQDLVRKGAHDNDASSLMVPQCCKVDIFENSGQTGGKESYGAGWHNLTHNDRMSSLKVREDEDPACEDTPFPRKPPSPPQRCKGEVTVYQHANFNYKSKDAKIASSWDATFKWTEPSQGKYDHDAFVAAGATNDDASSLMVPKCCKVDIYQHGDQSGEQRHYVAGWYNYLVRDDRMSSLRVVPDLDPACENNELPPMPLPRRCFGHVKISQHTFYNTGGFDADGSDADGWGAYFPWRLQAYNHEDLVTKGARNDDASSLMVPQCCKVDIFEHGDQTGDKRSYGAGWHNLEYNDRMSSLKVNDDEDPACADIKVSNQPPTPAPTPQRCTGNVYVYQHTNFNKEYSHSSERGWASQFGIGDYNPSALVLHGAKNDDASSLKVPRCCKVDIYQHGDFTGTHRQYSAGWHNLAYNDHMSSMKVDNDDPACYGRSVPPKPSPPPPPSCNGVEIFEHGNYGGWRASFSTGNYDHDAFVRTSAHNDAASSLKVPKCCTVVLYQHGDFSGWSKSYVAGDYSQMSHNDDMSSLRVTNDRSCKPKA